MEWSELPDWVDRIVRHPEVQEQIAAPGTYEARLKRHVLSMYRATETSQLLVRVETPRGRLLQWNLIDA